MALGNASDTGSNGLGQKVVALTQQDKARLQNAFPVVSATVSDARILFPSVVNTPQLQMYFRALVVRTILTLPSIDLLKIADLISDAVKKITADVAVGGAQWLSSEANGIVDTEED